MRFVDHHKVPSDVVNFGGLELYKLIGADDDMVFDLKRVEVSHPSLGVVRFGFQNRTGKEELFLQLLVPLLSEISRSDDEDSALAFSPLLGDHEACFDRLAESNFISEKSSLRERGTKCK